ncbi:hypothetical protein BU16DRAFT_554339 [Neofusicoccum parvum]|nr:hypothetical protein BU16DRAFT_554339 [Neofusicoccum parvum]
MFSFLGLEIASVTNGGVGYHALTEVPLADLQYSLKLLLALEVHYAILIALVKTSLLLFYRRIFSPHRALRLALGLIGAAVWLWSLSAVLTAFLLCAPLPFNWGAGAGSCGNRGASFIANGAANMLTDAAILVLPLPYIFALQMNLAKKAGVGAVLWAVGDYGYGWEEQEW